MLKLKQENKVSYMLSFNNSPEFIFNIRCPYLNIYKIKLFILRLNSNYQIRVALGLNGERLNTRILHDTTKTVYLLFRACYYPDAG